MSTQMIQIVPDSSPTPTQQALFYPQAAVAAPYDTIAWHNGDTQPHYPAPIVNGSVVKTGWFDYQIPAGGTSDTLSPGPNMANLKAEYVLQYACALHPGETGQITIRPKS
jgi:hypothetical protein